MNDKIKKSLNDYYLTLESEDEQNDFNNKYGQLLSIEPDLYMCGVWLPEGTYFSPIMEGINDYLYIKY
jgi:hypothetical protein